MTDEAIARVCHEANRAYCATLGDDSQPPWEEAPDWQHESAVEGVAFVRANPGAPPSASHDSWLKKKQTEGWMYSPVKNPEKKQHPCYMLFEDLPVEQQRKDVLFQSVVRSLVG